MRAAPASCAVGERGVEVLDRAALKNAMPMYRTSKPSDEWTRSAWNVPVGTVLSAGWQWCSSLASPLKLLAQ